MAVALICLGCATLGAVATVWFAGLGRVQRYADRLASRWHRSEER